MFEPSDEMGELAIRMQGITEFHAFKLMLFELYYVLREESHHPMIYVLVPFHK